MSLLAANAIDPVVILVVEDEFFVRADISDCLRGAGYVVVETATGEEAIALCKSDSPIDMLLTDINLTESVSGWDVAQCFHMERPEVVILYTSGDAIDLARCCSGSMFIAKPYQHNDILSACEQLCSK